MTQNFKIRHNPYFDTKKVEKLYSEKDGVPVKYVCTSALGGEEFARDIFYRTTPHPEFGNKYFGLYRDPDNTLFISAADKIEEVEFTMLSGTNGWEYSQHRHDYRQVGATAIDGGRAYVRLIGNLSVPTQTFKIKDGEFYEI